MLCRKSPIKFEIQMFKFPIHCARYRQGASKRSNNTKSRRRSMLSPSIAHECQWNAFTDSQLVSPAAYTHWEWQHGATNHTLTVKVKSKQTHTRFDNNISLQSNRKIDEVLSFPKWINWRYYRYRFNETQNRRTIISNLMLSNWIKTLCLRACCISFKINESSDLIL